MPGPALSTWMLLARAFCTPVLLAIVPDSEVASAVGFAVRQYRPGR
jgi:hypothetical protein